MSEGENTTTYRDALAIEFDPFQERTITRSTVTVEFETGNSVKVVLSPAQWRSADYNFLRISAHTKGLIGFSTILASADGEVLKPVRKGNGIPDGQQLRDGVRFDTEWSGLGHVDFSLDQWLKMAEAQKLEIRYYSGTGYSNLNDKEERKLLGILAMLYHETIDQSKFAQHAAEVTEEKKMFDDMQTMFHFIKWGAIGIVAIWVLSNLAS